MSLGPWEIFFIFLAILLLFGGKKIPEVARGLGKGLNEFKKAKDEITDSLKEAVEDSPKKDQKIIETKNIDIDAEEEKSKEKEKVDK